MTTKARRAPSAKQSQTSRRNIAKAHIARFRSREPRSIGRVRPVRRAAHRPVLRGRVR